MWFAAASLVCERNRWPREPALPTSPPPKSHDELLSDFLNWSKDILVSELAHLVWMVNQHNENLARTSAAA